MQARRHSKNKVQAVLTMRGADQSDQKEYSVVELTISIVGYLVLWWRLRQEKYTKRDEQG